jgi:hypothetical protein
MVPIGRGWTSRVARVRSGGLKGRSPSPHTPSGGSGGCLAAADGRAAHRAQDFRTLWTLTRNGLTAQCILLPLPARWELRVLVGPETLLTERCRGADEALDLAERWKHGLINRAWRQITTRRPE